MQAELHGRVRLTDAGQLCDTPGFGGALRGPEPNMAQLRNIEIDVDVDLDGYIA